MAKTIQDYKNDYAAAQAKGDKAGMAAANNAANALRQQQGQKVEVADVTKEVYGNNYVGAKKATSGSANNVTAWTDEQQAIKDQMNQNSQAWHNATSQEEKDRLHAENQQLAGQLGGNVGFNSGTGTWSGWSDESSLPGRTPSGSNAGNVTDLSSYLEQMYAAQREAALAAINNAYQQNIASIDSAKGQIAPQYQNARNQTAGTAEQAARNFAEYAAAYGLGSGSSAQADLARNITLQNNMNQLNAEEADAYAQLELQKNQAEIEYNNAIAEAEASNNSQLAAALYQEKVRVQEALMQQQQFLFDQALAERQFQFQQQSFDYQKQQDQAAADAEGKKYMAQWGASMLENGFMPTDEMLAAMGLSSDQAQAYIDFYKQMAAANAMSSGLSYGGYSGGKSGGTSGSGSYGGTGSYVSPPTSGLSGERNQPYTIDMNSVLQLGYGPIDSDSLANLEAQGKIESYTDGNMIKFRKTSDSSTPVNQSAIKLPSLGLMGR